MYALRGRLVKRSRDHVQFAGMYLYVVIHALLQSLLLTMEAYRCRDQIYPAVKNYPPSRYFTVCIIRCVYRAELILGR